MSIRMKVVLTACAVAVLALFVTTTFLSSQSVELITETELREMEIFGKVIESKLQDQVEATRACLLYTSPSPRDRTRSRMPSSA